MNKIVLLLCALMATAFFALAASPAYAQATRTWVSGVGDDANPCSRTAPCKTFAGAISKTATGGEINCLDSGGFGAVTITKSISIICNGVIAGVLASGTNAIIVNGANIEVLLSGLDIEGVNTGLNGVRVINAGTVTIRESTIRNFTQRGIDVQGPANTRVIVQDSQVISNNLGGFFMQGAAGAGNAAVIERTTFDLNGVVSVQVSGTSALVLSANTLAFSPASITTSGGAIVQSYGNNVFRGTGLPTQTLPLQ